jgi:osmotically-inducible protein OsmY
MRERNNMILVVLVGFAMAGLACTQRDTDASLDAAKEGAATAIDETQAAGKTFAEAAGDVAERTGDKTKELAKALSATTGEAITDTWITTKVRAKFVDETLLNGSRIDVETSDHVVTLRGTVSAAAAKERAGAIATGTEGVTRVLNYLFVT